MNTSRYWKFELKDGNELRVFDGSWQVIVRNKKEEKKLRKATKIMVKKLIKKKK